MGRIRGNTVCQASNHHVVLKYYKGGGATSTSAKASKAEVKEEESTGGEEETDYSKAKRALKTTEPSAKKKKHQAKVDSHVPSASFYQVEGDWDCMLNQTNIGHNNNKYYVIQMLKRQPIFHPM